MDLRTILVLATVLGFLITVIGLVAAWYNARKQYDEAKTRIDDLERLGEQERAEAKAHQDAATREESQARYDRWTLEYERHDLIRPTYSNLPYISAYESRRLLGLLLESTRRDFLVAAFGLLVSTAASVGSLFVTA